MTIIGDEKVPNNIGSQEKSLGFVWLTFGNILSFYFGRRCFEERI